MIPKIETTIDNIKKRSDIALIIVTFNQKDMTIDYLKKIKNQSVKTDIIVVENDSNDGTFDALKKAHDDIIILKTKANYGGAGGYYVGQKYAFDKKYKYLVLSENDVYEFSKDMVKNLYTKAKKDPSKIFQATNEFKRTGAAMFHFSIISYQILKKIGFVDYSLFFRGDDQEYGMRIKKENIERVILKDSLKHPIGGGALKGAMPLYFSIRNTLLNLYNYKKKSKLFSQLFLRIFTSLTYRTLFDDKVVSDAINLGISDFLKKKTSFKHSLDMVQKLKTIKIDYSKFQEKTIKISKKDDYFIMGEYSMNQYLKIKSKPISNLLVELLSNPFNIKNKEALTVTYSTPGGALMYFFKKCNFMNSFNYDKRIINTYYYEINKNFLTRTLILITNLIMSTILSSYYFIRKILS